MKCVVHSCGDGSQLSRSTEDGIHREEFVQWGAERFKSSKTIASKEALLRLYQAI